jgi:uncharacterized Rossmann fold enzyme
VVKLWNRRPALRRVERLASRLLSTRLDSLEGLHRGESCYIFGDGPSIKWFDFSKFDNLPAITCGMIPFHREFRLLDARYHMMVEPWLFCPPWIQPHLYLRQLKPIADAQRRIIESNRDVNVFVHLTNRLSIGGRNVNYVFRTLGSTHRSLDRALREFNLFSGSFHATLAMAYYLGFAKVYLVGFDAWTIEPARTLRWYERGNGEPFERTNYATQFLAVLQQEIDIHTITVSGTSPNVTSVSYEAHTGAQPMFRENTDLLDRKYLDALATFPEYRVL